MACHASDFVALPLVSLFAPVCWSLVGCNKVVYTGAGGRLEALVLWDQQRSLPLLHEINIVMCCCMLFCVPVFVCILL